MRNTDNIFNWNNALLVDRTAKLSCLRPPIPALVICWRHFYGPIYLSFVFGLCYDMYTKYISSTAQTDPPTCLTCPCSTIPLGCLWFPLWQTASFLFCYSWVFFHWHRDYERAQVSVNVLDENSNLTVEHACPFIKSRFQMAKWRRKWKRACLLTAAWAMAVLQTQLQNSCQDKSEASYAERQKWDGTHF